MPSEEAARRRRDRKSMCLEQVFGRQARPISLAKSNCRIEWPADEVSQLGRSFDLHLDVGPSPLQYGQLRQ